MPQRISESPSGRTRHWERRHKRSFPAPWYARPLLILISFILIATLTLRGVRYAWQSRHLARDAAARGSSTPPASTPAWQRDVIVSLDEAVRHASEVDLAPTEMSVDHAAAILTLARAKSQPASPDFFDATVRKLDDVLNTYHTNSRLTEHITSARIELAEFRSSLEPVPPGTPESIQADDILVQAATGSSPRADAPAASGANANTNSAAAAPASAAAKKAAGASASSTAKHSGRGAANEMPPGHIIFLAPRDLASGALLDPAALGGNFIDATGMPSLSEILEPPSSRLFADNVRVENLTIAGAAQTLDGVHWKNVTFIGTRLRYEGGELDLHNVRFVRCLFGFTTDDRAARIATAIAEGQTTIVIE
jgi:hypothetical protein